MPRCRSITAAHSSKRGNTRTWSRCGAGARASGSGSPTASVTSCRGRRRCDPPPIHAHCHAAPGPSRPSPPYSDGTRHCPTRPHGTFGMAAVLEYSALTRYIDRWRNRLPNYEKQTGLKDHIDNGSLARYRRVLPGVPLRTLLIRGSRVLPEYPAGPSSAARSHGQSQHACVWSESQGEAVLCNGTAIRLKASPPVRIGSAHRPARSLLLVTPMRTNPLPVCARGSVGGSVDHSVLTCSWLDPAWQVVYKHIMDGDLDAYDPWDVPPPPSLMCPASMPTTCTQACSQHNSQHACSWPLVAALRAAMDRTDQTAHGIGAAVAPLRLRRDPTYPVSRRTGGWRRRSRSSAPCKGGWR